MLTSKIPPHIEFMNKIKETMDNAVAKDKSLTDFYIKIMNSGTTSNVIPKNKSEIELFSNLNLYFTLNNAQEILIKNGLTNYIIPMYNKVAGSESNSVELPNNFKTPFEEMVFTFSIENGGEEFFSTAFIQVFAFDEYWIDPLDKSNHKVFCVKLMARNKGEQIKPIDLYGAVSEILIIPTRLPRFYFPKRTSKYCRNCTQDVSSDILKHLQGAIYDKNSECCLRTIRSACNCANRAPNANYAQQGIANFLVISNIMDKLYASPKKIKKIAEQIRSSSDDSKVIKRNSDRHYIELKDSVYSYVGPKLSEKSNSTTHASPVEHLRRGHIRRMKNGAIVNIKESIVNKGGKKSVYVIGDKHE